MRHGVEPAGYKEFVAFVTGASLSSRTKRICPERRRFQTRMDPEVTSGSLGQDVSP